MLYSKIKKNSDVFLYSVTTWSDNAHEEIVR